MTYVSCPIPGCDWVRQPEELLCRQHWKMVPADLRSDVWREFRRQRGSPEHLAACKAAIAAVLGKGPQQQLAL